MKQSVTQGSFALRGKLLYLLWTTYKMAEVGQPQPTALATSMGTTEEESPRLEHAAGKVTERGEAWHRGQVLNASDAPCKSYTRPPAYGQVIYSTTRGKTTSDSAIPSIASSKNRADVAATRRRRLGPGLARSEAQAPGGLLPIAKCCVMRISEGCVAAISLHGKRLSVAQKVI
jgi:hypothetical protein